MEKKEYIIAIDLGDSNIVVAVGSAAEGGRVNIHYIMSRPSSGVSSGQIVNIESAVRTIQSALQELEDATGIKVLEAYAGISGEFIYSTSHTDHVFVPDHKYGVTKQVVDALYERMKNVMVSEDRIIMERIPQRYVINDTTEVDNPVGVFGSPLSSTFNFISSKKDLFDRLDMALRRLNITPRRIFSNAVVVGDALLSEDEKEDGVVVVDIGGELTDISIYHRKVLRYISTIPMGAKLINDDIRTLTIPKQYIEPLKLRYGYALSKNTPQDVNVIIKGRSKHDQREIAIYNLAAVIEARARDIVELVSKEITDSGFVDKVPYGIVLTGGSAQLRGLDELFREITDMEVRVAEPEEVVSPKTRQQITSSADSTVVGLLLHGLKHGPCAVELGEPKIVEKAVETPPEPQVVTPPVAPVVPAAPVAQPPVVQPPVQPSQRVIPTPVQPGQRVIHPPVQPPVPPVQPGQRIVQPPVTPPVVPPVVNQNDEEEKKDLAQEFINPTVEGSEAPHTINSHLGEFGNLNDTSEINNSDEFDDDEPVANEPEKPKRRIIKILSNLASGTNKWVNKVNTHFDVDEEV